jgi:hypothetical protein
MMARGAAAIEIAPHPSVRSPGDHAARQDIGNVALAVIEQILYIRGREILANVGGRSALQVRVLSQGTSTANRK